MSKPMPLMVDGNNALGFGRLTEQELILRLARLSRSRSLRIVLFFDGARDHGERRQVVSKLTIHYSGPYQSADDLILSEVSKLVDTHGWIVHTNDQALARAVRDFHVATERVDPLLAQLADYARKVPPKTDDKPGIEYDVDGLAKAMMTTS